MAIRTTILLSVLLFYLCQVQSQSKQCVRFKDSPLASCASAGYNYTYPLPDDLSAMTLNYIQRFVTFMSKAAENCSVANMAESIMCMSYAPKCDDVNQDPVLPCRRVCSELMKRCFTTISPFVADWMLKQCLVLPNTTAASGKCFEPMGFEKYYNASSKGPLERGCQKLVNFPFCENLGYKYTMLTAKSQTNLYRFFYRKNITSPNKETPSPRSILARFIQTTKKAPKCTSDMKKLFCSEIVPPCFPDEGPAFYTVCKPICKSIGENCPQVLEGRGQLYYGECERMAPGTASHGYCKHSKLPPITDWGDYLSKPKPSSTPPKGLGTTQIIIISVVVPLVAIIIIIIVIAIVLRKRKLTSMFNYQRHE